jgi:hypothetical protein
MDHLLASLSFEGFARFVVVAGVVRLNLPSYAGSKNEVKE